MGVSKVSRQRVSDQVLEQLKEQILDGSFPQGAPLPSEHELCSLFGTSRTAIREAVRQLELMGLVDSRQGARRLVRNRDELWAIPLLREILRPRTAEPGFVGHLLELQRDFLLSAYERAGRRGTPEDWAKMREIAQTPVPDRSSYLRRDWEFWKAVGDASRNPIHRTLMRHFVAALESMLPLIEPVAPQCFFERPFYEPMIQALEEGRAALLRPELSRILEEDDSMLLRNLENLEPG